jgi:hypothetical protein
MFVDPWAMEVRSYENNNHSIKNLEKGISNQLSL